MSHVELKKRTDDLHPTQTGGIVSLAVSLDELVNRYKLFDEVKLKLLTENDYYEVKLGSETKNTIRKSGWYKFAVAFNLSTEVSEEQTLTDPEDSNYLGFSFKVKCFADNGRYAEDVGTCDNRESLKKSSTRHELRAMAKTRATIRAIASIMGVNDLIAEDLDEVQTSINSPTSATPYNRETSYCRCTFADMKPDAHGQACITCGGTYSEKQLTYLRGIGKVR
jgi:hypothetical protein